MTWGIEIRSPIVVKGEEQPEVVPTDAFRTSLGSWTSSLSGRGFRTKQLLLAWLGRANPIS